MYKVYNVVSIHIIWSIKLQITSSEVIHIHVHISLDMPHVHVYVHIYVTCTLYMYVHVHCTYIVV